MAGKGGQTHLCPFAESFALGYAQRVAHAQSLGLVTDVQGIAIEMVGIEFSGIATADVFVFKPAHIKGVDEAGHGNKFLRCGQRVLPVLKQRIHCCHACNAVILKDVSDAVGQVHKQFLFTWWLGFQRVGNRDVAFEAKVVSVGQIIGSFIVPVPCAGQHDGDVNRGVVVLETLRVFNVIVIFYTTVFCHLHVVCIEIGVHVVALTAVISVDAGSEHAVLLAVVVSASVEIVQFETNASELVDIGGEIRSETVFTSLVAAKLVVGQIGDGTFGVGKTEVG